MHNGIQRTKGRWSQMTKEKPNDSEKSKEAVTALEHVQVIAGINNVHCYTK